MMPNIVLFTSVTYFLSDIKTRITRKKKTFPGYLNLIIEIIELSNVKINSRIVCADFRVLYFC